MVFGLFSRKSQPPQPTQPQSQPQPQSQSQPRPASTSGSGSGSLIFPVASPRLVQFQQLRTPSPSVDSASIGKTGHSPLQPGAFLHAYDSPGPHPPITPSPPPDPLITDPATLHALLLTIPPKILHEYTLSHLIPPSQPLSPLSPAPAQPILPPSPTTLTTLTAFFSSLAPPPRLHCVRCHKGFFDVENDDRSCLVPHDDDSAEVERVGAGRGTGLGTEYETLWGCCGKTVEGDGDMGPPDGWCYEGKHTTDPKRARFRADSTLHDDKLTSCVRLRCHDPLPARYRSSRKRVRAVDESDEDKDEGVDDSGVDEILSRGSTKGSVRSKGKAKAKAVTKGKGKALPREEEGEASDESMNVDKEGASPSASPKPKPKPKPRAKPKPIAKPKSTAAKSKSVIGTPSPPTTPSFPPATRSATSSPKSASRLTKSMSKPTKPLSRAGSLKNGMKGRKLGEVIATSVVGEDMGVDMVFVEVDAVDGDGEKKRKRRKVA